MNPTHRRRWLGRALAAVMLLATGPAFAHSGTGPHNYGHSALGGLRIGVVRSGTPFAYRRDGEPRGFEVDLARAVAAEMAIPFTLRWMKREAALAALGAGDIDLAIGGVLEGPPPPALDRVPYLVVGEHVMVRRDNPFGVHAADDLSGTMVVATMKSGGARFAESLAGAIAESGRAPMEVHRSPRAAYTPVAVLFAHAAAYFAPSAAAALQSVGPDARAKPVAGLFAPEGALGFVFPTAAFELKRDLKLALAQVVAKGEYARLLAAYAIPPDCSPFR